MNRRDMLKWSAGAAGVCLTGANTRSLFAAQDSTDKIPVGIQLWCVRGELAQDLPGTFKTLAELGYKGVEFFGYGGQDKIQGLTGEQLRAELDEAGLVCCGIHTNKAALEDANFEATVAMNKKLGNRFLVIAANAAQMGEKDDIQAFAEFLNQKAEEARKLDMRVGYHAHPFDFKRFDGVTGWELLFSATEKDVIMQLDVGNCLGGDGEPIKMLEKFPGRCSSLHIKEHPGGPLGGSDIDWDRIFDLCETKHDTEWYVVEQVGPEFTMAAQAIEALREMGKM